MSENTLKSLRIKTGITQDQAANLLNTSASTVKGRENRYKTPPCAIVALEMFESMDESDRAKWMNKKRT